MTDGASAIDPAATYRVPDALVVPYLILAGRFPPPVLPGSVVAPLRAAVRGEPGAERAFWNALWVAEGRR